MKHTTRSSDLRGFWGLAAAQFLGAFNDNALRWFLIALAMREVQSEEKAAGIMALATGVFLLPYLLFSMHAGSLADHFSKRHVLMVSKAAETAVMLFCMVGLLISEQFSFTLPYLLVGLFLMGAQSTYYSPAKFGVLPELLPEEILSWGNGIFEMTGMLAIILGSIYGAECVGLFARHLFLAPLSFAVAAAMGLVATWLVPPVPPAAPHEPVRVNPLIALREHARVFFRRRLLFVILLSVVAVWSLGVLFQLNVALYAKENLGFDERHAALPMGAIAVGIAAGTVCAGYLSGNTIEMGLVPIGAMGIAGASFALCFTAGSLMLSFLCVTVLGIFAGFFIVPNHALLQEESPLERKGSVWAATNFLQTCGMLVAAQLFAFFHSVLGLHAPQVFLVSGIGIFALGVLLFSVLPESLARTAAWVYLALSCKVTVSGQEHIPAHGPVVFCVRGKVPHARRYFLALLAGTRRFVRFVLPRSFLKDPIVSFCARNLRAIVYGDRGNAPQQTAQAVVQALARGGAVAFVEDQDRKEVAQLAGHAGAVCIVASLQGEGRQVHLAFEAPRHRARS